MLDRNYPRLDGTLALTRARVAEVREVAQASASAPAAPLERASVLPTAAPRLPDLPRPTSNLPTQPPVAAERQPTLRTTAPEKTDLGPRPAPSLPRPSQPEHVPIVATHQSPRPVEEAKLPRPAPGVETQHPAAHTPTHEMFEPVDAVDYSRIVWRAGPETR